MKRSVKIAIVTLAVSMFSIPMFAATTVPTANANNVTAAVVGSCQWVTPLTMAFPGYDPFNASATTQTTTVKFKCVTGTVVGDTYKVFFSKSGGNMTNGGFNLAYTLTDAAAVAVPTTSGTAASPTSGTSGVGAAKGYLYTVNGSITPGQDVPVGAYQDTVTVNIYY